MATKSALESKLVEEFVQVVRNLVQDLDGLDDRASSKARQTARGFHRYGGQSPECLLTPFVLVRVSVLRVRPARSDGQ